MAGPIKASAFVLETSLFSQSTGAIVANPTLASGDVKVKKDDGTHANISTLPTCAAADGIVKISLSGSEMNADIVTVRFIDAAGAEWRDKTITIYTETGTLTSLTTGVTVTTNGITAASIATGAITDAKISYTDDPSGPATGVFSRINQLWRYLIGSKSKLNTTTGKFEGYKADNSTVAFDMDATNTGGIQTKGPAEAP